MPSPFPGMDPYLEHPGLWPGVHASLIATLRELLTPLLKPRFWVDIEERLYVEEEDIAPRSIRPDLVVSTGRRHPRKGSTEPALAPGFVEVQDRIEAPVRETSLVIKARPGRQVVTVVEVLSPTNKGKGVGRDEYHAKRTEILSSTASLVEVDLLRAGDRPSFLGRVGPHEYLVLVHRGWERQRAWARGWTLFDPIPEVPIPLRAEDPVVMLDLPRALALVYDRGGYELVLDYRQPAEPPLGAADARRAKTLMKRARP